LNRGLTTRHYHAEIQALRDGIRGSDGYPTHSQSASKGHSARPVVRIVIVDDHVFMRDLMARTLGQQSEVYAVVATAGTAADAIAACAELRPGLLILDINLPDKNGIDALPVLKRVAPAMRVLLCTGYPTDDRISDLAATGAHGFVEKTNTWHDFLHAVDQISRAEYYFCSHTAGIAPQRGRLQQNGRSFATSSLTAREKQIIALIAQGLISKEIAAGLHISYATVETHRANLMTKIGAKNVAELVSYAFRTGLVKPDSKGWVSR
jgi:DNA-binding NarL/FixJ family response regulator